MVAEAFLFKPNANYVVNHIDGNKLNDNVGNLEYISSGQNNKHALVSGLRHPSSKISYDDMVEISFRIKYCNESCTSIYNSIKDRIPVTLGAIKNIKQRKRYLKYTDSVEFELADACIRLLDLAGLRGIDLSSLQQVEYPFGVNETFTEFCFGICKQITSFRPGRIEFSVNIHVVLMEIFSYCRAMGIDLLWFIEQKMKYNELRPYKHGNKSY